MKLFVLHISDIHLKAASSVALERLLLVAPAVQNLDEGVGEVAVVVSGDVAWSGETAEYALARAAFDRLREDLLKRFKGATVQFFFVPGNHDCNLTGDQDARNHVLHGVRSSGTTMTIKPSTVNLCCAVQSSYDGFAKGLTAITPLADHDRMYVEYVLPVGERRVLVKCYNTAWMSTNPEVQASLVFPDYYTALQPAKKSYDYYISVFHHPYSWLRSSNALSFRKHVEESSDLVLTGHEHDGSQYEKKDFSGTVTSYFEGAVFQDHHDPERSGFMSMLVDFEGQKQRVFRYEWDTNLYVQTESTSGWVSWSRGTRTANRDFVVAPEFLQTLNDLGVVLTHPARERLTLNDIYVIPNFKELRIGSKLKTTSKLIRGAEFLSTLLNQKRVFVFGQQQSGKSCLAKRVFAHFFDRNITPVLLRGSDIRSVSLDHAEKLLSKAFSEQYLNPQLPAFTQLDRDKILIIIDDFEKALNPRGRGRFLDALCGRYERVFVLADDLLKLEELVTGDVKSPINDSFAQYQVQEFGHELRNKLIHAWYEIGSEYAADPVDLENRVCRAEALINDLLGRSYLPSFPIYVLSFLQALDAGTPIAADAGTYGSLYEVLITGNLASTKSKKFNLDTRRTYLSEMAYWMFCEGKTQFSDAEWSVFHDSYRQKYKSNATRKDLKEELVRARMLVELDELFKFRHPYYYHYFVARHLQNNLHSESNSTVVREQVLSLCDQLDKEEQANICLFLTHLSKDPFILNAILERASKIFSEYAPADFRDDLAFLKGLSEQLPAVTLTEADYTERKEQRLRDLDQAKDAEMEGTAMTQEALDVVNRFKLAVRTLEVLGQIVKNFHGSLVAEDKRRVVQECYLLGLRSIAMVLSTVSTHSTEFVQWYAEKVREAHPDLVVRADIEAKIGQSIFQLVEIGCFGMLKRISHAVGHSDLEATYEEILNVNPTPAMRLVDVSVKLDTVSISQWDAKRTKKSLMGNLLCESLLNRLAVYYFYIFPSKQSVRQRVCSELGIQLIHDLNVISDAQKKLPMPDKQSEHEG